MQVIAGTNRMLSGSTIIRLVCDAEYDVNR
jgi:hypothetical protein